VPSLRAPRCGSRAFLPLPSTRPDAPALDGVSLRVAPGETVALVGPSGGGKTTIIQLPPALLGPGGGSRDRGGADLRDLARASLRAQVRLVPQDPVIFADTARANIRFGGPSATDAEVEDAARAGRGPRLHRGAARRLRHLPGRARRDAVGRPAPAHRHRPRRAARRAPPPPRRGDVRLDAESERAVQDAVEALAQGRTTVIVAHRLSTVKRADRIVVLEGGRVVAEGTHDALVAQGGLYARLARLQFTEGMAAE
jgi:ATP-binding cassette subfamily B protein